MIADFESKKILFIEIPKNGTTSVREWFFKNSNTSRELNDKLTRHYSFSNAINCINIDFDFIFSITRNPFDRLVSEYSYWQMLAHNPSEAQRGKHHTLLCAQLIKEYDTFLKFVKLKLDKNSEDFPNPYLVQTSQTEMLVGFDKKTISPRIRILNQETLQKDFDNLISDIVGGATIDNYKTELPNFNSSQRRKDYKTYYDERAIEIVKDFYENDIRNLNYEI